MAAKIYDFKTAGKNNQQAFDARDFFEHGLLEMVGQGKVQEAYDTARGIVDNSDDVVMRYAAYAAMTLLTPILAGMDDGVTADDVQAMCHAIEDDWEFADD